MKKVQYILILVSCNLFTSSTSSVRTLSKLEDNLRSKPEMNNYLLPKDVKPISYDLYLHPNLVTETFSGKITIETELLANKSEIRLHNNGLTIHNVQIDGNEGKHNTDATYELLQITSSDSAPIEAGKRKLVIEFSGDMKNRYVGLYSSKYLNENGTHTAIATSKFEPTYARQAYPCFDEPNKKAKFSVHLLKPHDERYIALSNMPQIGEEETKDGVLVHFQESVKMSTYLTCFIVSDFKYTENFILPEEYNIPFRVYATPAQLSKTTFATDTGVKIIEHYIKYFGIPYPLPKLDMVGIPDFVSGAMEHWGLVTFRETSLLYDKSISSTANKQRIASVVAHELAHSWFGNLVTMDWWNDIWLNEGFASYIEYRGVNAIYPEWQMMDQFLCDDLHPVLTFDARKSTHAIIQSVATPDEITSIFDTISYNKGSSLLRMLEDAVTEAHFQQAVTNYLNAHLYDNAVTQDLLDELQKIVGDELNISEFMKTWTVQMGYPVLDVKMKDNNYVLTQKRFLLNPKETKSETYKWTIPVTYITSENSTPQYIWFHHDMDEIVVPKPSAKWLKFNYKQVGYYRVNYENWDELVDNVHEMSIADKTHLLEETFSLAASGQINYEIPLNFVKYLETEDNYVPWNVASSKLKNIKNHLSNSDVLSEFQLIINDIVNPAYQKLGWNESDSDTHLQRLARTAILTLACSFEDPVCIEEARNQFLEWMNGERDLSQDLRSLVYTFGMKEATVDEWNQLWEKFVNETDAGEKLKLLRGLASIHNPSQLIRLIELAKTDKYIRKQDYFSCLGYISANPVGTLLVWDYVRENWPYLVDRFTLNDRYLGSILPTIVGTFSTNTKREELLAFYEKYPEAGAGVAARQRALEIIDDNILWLQNNKKTVEDWIKKESL